MLLPGMIIKMEWDQNDVVFGHSMGGARIQGDNSLGHQKIVTFQAPIQVQSRGTHFSTYLDWLNLLRSPSSNISGGGHTYQSGQVDQYFGSQSDPSLAELRNS